MQKIFIFIFNLIFEYYITLRFFLFIDVSISFLK